MSNYVTFKEINYSHVNNMDESQKHAEHKEATEE